MFKEPHPRDVYRSHRKKRATKITEDDPRWGPLQYKKAKRLGAKPSHVTPWGGPGFKTPKGSRRHEGPYGRHKPVDINQA